MLTIGDFNSFWVFLGHPVQGVPKKLQTIESNLLLEFQWTSTNLKIKSAKY